MITTTKLKPTDKPTKEQLKRIEKAAQKPIAHDKNSPEYTLEQLSWLYSESKRLNKNKRLGLGLITKP